EREIFVESGARESVFLERPMAVAIGHDAAEEVPAKRTYLLLDQDTIQILGVDGINPAVNYTHEMAIDYLYDSQKKESTPLGTGDIAPLAAQKILAIFSDLKTRGYIEKEVYIWGSDEKNIADRILGESNLHWRKIKLEYAIDGASIVIDDLAPRLRLKTKQASRT